MQKMIKCKIKKGSLSKLRISGTANEVCNEIAVLIHVAYNGIKRFDPDAGEKFKRRLIGLLLDPKSPVFSVANK